MFYIIRLLGGTNYERNKEYTESKYIVVIRQLRPQGYSQIGKCMTLLNLMSLLPLQLLCEKEGSEE